MKKFKKLTKKQPESKITYSEHIIENIVLLSIAELEDVSLISPTYGNNQSRSIRIKTTKNEITVDVNVKINYNQSISEMAYKIQDSIRHNVESMTENKIANVNIFVNGITFNDKITAEENTPQEDNGQEATTINKE
ncbi:MAG: Asp23/Gls24 family envelope stress response protein [Clostridia bacterium]|nr:Asp23/Gls24 family envelope stress response protein [Clostridia bacterium]